MLNKLINKLTRADWGAEFFALIRTWERYLYCLSSTILLRLQARMIGIKLGHDVKFNGIAFLDRFKHSTIIIGNDCIFNSNIHFNPRGCRRTAIHTATDFARIIIGDNCGFSGVSIVAHKEIIIGKNVMVGADSQIGDTDDHNDILGTVDAPVHIGDNVFIGMHCMILKGVTIGNNAIIAAGSVVTKDIPANSVAGGVPCKVIRMR